MDVLTRIKSTEFKKLLLNLLQNTKLLKNVIPVDLRINPVERRLMYLSLRCKLVQDINAKTITTEKRLLHDMAVLYIIAKKSDKGFDKKYQDLVGSLDKYMDKFQKDLLEA